MYGRSLPHISEMVAAITQHDASVVGQGCDDQFEFEFASDLVVDGFERLLETKPRNRGLDPRPIRRRRLRRSWRFRGVGTLGQRVPVRSGARRATPPPPTVARGANRPSYCELGGARLGDSLLSFANG